MNPGSKLYVKKVIGENIKRERVKIGYSQAQFGNLINLTRASIINIESGRHSPTNETIYIICCILKCTPNDIFPATKKIVLKSKTKIKHIVKKITTYQPVKI